MYLFTGRDLGKAALEPVNKCGLLLLVLFFGCANVPSRDAYMSTNVQFLISFDSGYNTYTCNLNSLIPIIIRVVNLVLIG